MHMKLGRTKMSTSRHISEIMRLLVQIFINFHPIHRRISQADRLLTEMKPHFVFKKTQERGVEGLNI